MFLSVQLNEQKKKKRGGSSFATTSKDSMPGDTGLPVKKNHHMDTLG